MDRRTKVETHLKLYKTYRTAVENCELHLDSLIPSGVGSYGEFTGGGSFQSATEIAAVRRMEYLQGTIETYRAYVNCIERAIEALDGSETSFVCLRYFDALDMSEIAQRLSYSLRTATNIRARTLDKLTISLVAIL
jgi:hypothetical protein